MRVSCGFVVGKTEQRFMGRNTPSPCGKIPSVQHLTRGEADAWRMFTLAHSRVAERIERALHPLGLSLGDFEVLLTLLQAPHHRLRMSDLAYRVAMSRSGLTRQVDRLVRRGLVRRAKCPKDKRGLYAVLSDAGRTEIGAALPQYEEAVRKFFATAVEERSRAGFTELLARVLDAAADAEECASAKRAERDCFGEQ